uniref:Cytochrome P450 n=1 Tax=Photinus pyralis TaxID=7054 RepID=A0A1Y1LHE5_PHOPY
MWFLVIFLVLIITLYKVRKIYTYWKGRGVPYCVHPLHCFGLFSENALRINCYSDVFEELYYKFKNKRYIGFYNFFQPVLLIRDPNLLKRICVKDYHAFSVHSEAIPLNLDEQWSKNMYAETNTQRWQKLRTSMTPSFTSNKLKSSFPAVEQFAIEFVNYLRESIDKNVTVNMLEIIRRVLSDITVNAYFGVKCDSLREPKNIVHLMVHEAMTLPCFHGFTHLCSRVCPKLLQLLGVKVYKASVQNFFAEMMERRLQLEFENGFKPYDIITALPELQGVKFSNTEKLNRSLIDDITGHAFLLTFAGYETTVTTLMSLLYELTVNDVVQENLYRDIIQTLDKYNGNVCYESVKAMEYLESAIEEVLRLHPPAPVIDRLATVNYEIKAEHPNEEDVVIEKGTPIWILAKAIQNDADYFPDPKKFNPDRFLSKNRHTVAQYTNIPIGAGPRSCPGYRYGILQVKVIIVNLLLNFKLLPTEQTYVRKSSKTYTIRKHGVWVHLKTRLK